jgi:putative spermidine/putrescine transport system ATP-binding protein
MQLEIRRLHRELGATFIYVTHDQEEALTLSDRICLMNQARVEQVGTPDQMYDRPASRFAAGFIGHSNLLDGADGGGATVMVRPENVRLVAPPEGALAGSVREVVFQGADLKVLVDVGRERLFSVRLHGRGARPAAGDRVGLAWEPQHAVALAR